MNHRPPVGLCLDSNEDRGATEHLANLDQMGIWSDIASFILCSIIACLVFYLTLYSSDGQTFHMQGHTDILLDY